MMKPRLNAYQLAPDIINALRALEAQDRLAASNSP
jgi:hypothetical protein